jgi:hypothetical protein
MSVNAPIADRKEVSHFSSLASSVLAQLLDLREHGRRQRRITRRTRRRVEAIREMFSTGGRYATDAAGSLDAFRSSAETLELAEELKEMALKRSGQRERFSMSDWAARADRALAALETAEEWTSLPDRDFVERELIPLLAEIRDLPPAEPETVTGAPLA